MKKILLAAGIAFLGLSHQVHAQTFSFDADTVSLNTLGLDPPAGSTSYDGYTLSLYNPIKNPSTNASDSIQVHWSILSNNLPFGWSLFGFCDNIMCHVANSPELAIGYDNITNWISAGDTSLFEPQFAVPTSGDNGTGILQVRVWTATQADTVYFIVSKTPTGVAQIPVGDKRVLLYPNPVTANQLNLFTDKSISAKNVVVYDIAGREVVNYPVNAGTELQSFNIAAFGAGSYVANVMDDNGKVLAVRRFVKQ